MRQLRQMHSSKIITTIVILSVLAISISLSSCGKADISAYADKKIEIIGLTDEDFTITVGELAEMDCISCKAVGETEKAGTVRGYGPTLKTFVENYGASLDDFSMIRATASDKYVVLLGPASWDQYDVVLSIANGSQALDAYQQPMRIVIPGGKSGNWARMVIKMEFIRK